MLATLLRRLTATGLRRGASGSRAWLVVGIAAAGIRLLRHVTRETEEVLYRTRLREGDVFEVVTKPRSGK